MIILGKETVTYQNKLYYIYRKVKSTQLKTEYVSELKEFWVCDIVIRGRHQNNDDVFLFLREISDAIVISQT
jgi:hypothetical protein